MPNLRTFEQSQHNKPRIPILVRNSDTHGIIHDEQTAEAVDVGADGALVFLPRPVSVGESIQILNLVNGTTASAQVVWEGGFSEDGRARAGIQLVRPSYRFWSGQLKNPTRFFGGLVVALSALLTGFLISNAAISAFQEGRTLMGILGAYFATGFWVFLAVWVINFARRKPYGQEVLGD